MKYFYNTLIVLLDKSSVADQDQGRQGWNKYSDINSIDILYYYCLSLSSEDVFEEELKAIVVCDDTIAMIIHCNVLDIF